MVYVGKRVADVGFVLKALGDDAGGEDEVVKGEGGGPGTGDCWKDVSRIIGNEIEIEWGLITREWRD